MLKSAFQDFRTMPITDSFATRDPVSASKLWLMAGYQTPRVQFAP